MRTPRLDIERRFNCQRHPLTLSDLRNLQLRFRARVLLPQMADRAADAFPSATAANFERLPSRTVSSGASASKELIMADQRKKLNRTKSA